MTTRIMDCGECFLGKAHLEEINGRLIGDCQRCGRHFDCSATPSSTNDMAGFMAFLVGRLQAIDKLNEAQGIKREAPKWTYAPMTYRRTPDETSD